MECVEDLVLSFLTQLSEALPSAYSQSDVKKGSGKKVILRLADRTKEYSDDNNPLRQLAFPRQTKGPSARPFAQLFRVADLIHEALLDGIPMSKRDMFYKDVQLFRSQATVDKLVDDLAATFQFSRADLNVRASSKGLLCGSGLTIHLKSGDILGKSDSEASLIPHSEDIDCFEVGENLAWVLVVEKEAVFQTLCTLRFAIHEALPGPGLIVTGKGYPDVATRQLIRTLSDNLSSHIPILALVDGDAYGIDILSVYRHGSTRMQHENEHLAAARVQWLGIWASELSSLGIDKDALLPITKHDEKKARSMLRRRWLPAQWRKELQYMLFSRRKAEIEVLGAARASRDPGLGRDRLVVGGNTGIPLVRYLVAKICAVCADPDHEIL
ncbi:DNA topoisomerase IV alpha subunit [Lentinus tigrinus ALCF2SS1-6]|uniref:DNA topoisomerase (ATP-hydrolyzing) n=1 Tax=Lentinus tigrinus ALCF2SS1-6 TaxID=1328759 RepID=A0A5C2SJK4_9APHY|nr:DNA topoisomerase IV alpha subunit [Lentinus tigrinus ALCF2SS1-6]